MLVHAKRCLTVIVCENSKARIHQKISKLIVIIKVFPQSMGNKQQSCPEKENKPI